MVFRRALKHLWEFSRKRICPEGIMCGPQEDAVQAGSADAMQGSQKNKTPGTLEGRRAYISQRAFQSGWNYRSGWNYAAMEPGKILCRRNAKPKASRPRPVPSRISEEGSGVPTSDTASISFP